MNTFDKHIWVSVQCESAYYTPPNSTDCWGQHPLSCFGEEGILITEKAFKPWLQGQSILNLSDVCVWKSAHIQQKLGLYAGEDHQENLYEILKLKAHVMDMQRGINLCAPIGENSTWVVFNKDSSETPDVTLASPSLFTTTSTVCFSDPSLKPVQNKVSIRWTLHVWEYLPSSKQYTGKEHQGDFFTIPYLVKG